MERKRTKSFYGSPCSYVPFISAATFVFFQQHGALNKSEIVHAGRTLPAHHGVGRGLQRAAQRDPHEPGGAEQARAQARVRARERADSEDQRDARAVYTGGKL